MRSARRRGLGKITLAFAAVDGTNFRGAATPLSPLGAPLRCDVRCPWHCFGQSKTRHNPASCNILADDSVTGRMEDRLERGA